MTKCRSERGKSTVGSDIYLEYLCCFGPGINPILCIAESSVKHWRRPDGSLVCMSLLSNIRTMTRSVWNLSNGFLLQNLFLVLSTLLLMLFVSTESSSMLVKWKRSVTYHLQYNNFLISSSLFMYSVGVEPMIKVMLAQSSTVWETWIIKY